MDRITFTKNTPKTFILAAENWPEANFGDDQVWSLVFNHADSHPFHLYTTYGLKARSVQVFPEIIKDNQALNSDEYFAQPPSVTHYTPGFLRVAYKFKFGLDVEFDALAPEPFALAGTISLKNQGRDNLGFKLALISHLIPLDKGFRTHAEKVGMHQILSGKADDLCPVMVMSGGPSAANTPFPALTQPLQLAPGDIHTATWALAARRTQEESFKSAWRLSSQSWQPATQKLQMDQARQTFQIQTGNPDWNAAFSLAQTIPYTHFIHHNEGGAAPCVVRTRLPNQAPVNARKLDELDDLTTLELNHLAQVMLPQRPKLLASLLMKFLNRIEANGQLLTKRNPSPYIQPYQEPPLMAGLCLEIFEITQDEAYLQKVFPLLWKITGTWLYSELDGRSENPITWQTPDQCQLRSGMYKFDIWEETGGGLDIQTVESPALLAMLLREVRSLTKMAEILEAQNAVKRYNKLEKRLKKNLKTFWNEEQKSYLYRDYQSKTSPHGEEILKTKNQNEIMVDRKFKAPQRLVCHIHACDDRTRVCHLAIIGLDAHGNEIMDSFKPSEIRWIAGRTHLTSRQLFSALQSLKIKGLASGDEITLETFDLSQGDITCLAPIWSGDLPKDHLQSLLNEFLDWEQSDLSMGIPEVFPAAGDTKAGLEIAVNVLWNTLILQGLARNGYTEAAARLFENLMSTIIQGLRNFEGFFPHFQAQNGGPLGKPNVISGLPPLRLFLEIAGIRIVSPRKVALWGNSPFSWPISINWQGLSIIRDQESTHITFPDGTTYSHNDPEPVILTPESEGL